MTTEILSYLVQIQWWIIGFLTVLVTGIIAWAIKQHFDHDERREREVDEVLKGKKNIPD
jgi:hypothetical protein